MENQSNLTTPPSDTTESVPPPSNPQTPQQRISAGQIYPSAKSIQSPSPTTNPNSYIGLTGSSLQKQNRPLPKVIYVIVAWNLIGVVLDFLNTSQTGLLATSVLLGNLLLSIGLLLRMNIVRQILVGLYALTITVSIVSIILLVGLQNRIHDIEAQYQVATARFRGDSATSEQKKNVAALDKVLAENKEKANGTFLVGYIRQGGAVVISVAIMVYLTRPNIKEAFETSGNKV